MLPPYVAYSLVQEKTFSNRKGKPTFLSEQERGAVLRFFQDLCQNWHLTGFGLIGGDDDGIS